MEAMDPFIDDLPIKILIFQFALVVYHSLYQEKTQFCNLKWCRLFVHVALLLLFAPHAAWTVVFSARVVSGATKTQRNVVIQLKFGKDWKLWYDPNL
jgi:hypothetical protein